MILQNSETYKLYSKYIHPDIMNKIIEFIFGKEHILLYSELIGDIQKSFLYAKYDFIEGIEYYITRFSFDQQIMNSLLYGSASSGNINLTNQLRLCGFTDMNNLTDAINFALENGHLYYIKYIMYMEKIPNVPLSIYKWLKYCENKKS